MTPSQALHRNTHAFDCKAQTLMPVSFICLGPNLFGNQLPGAHASESTRKHNMANRCAAHGRTEILAVGFRLLFLPQLPS